MSACHSVFQTAAMWAEILVASLEKYLGAIQESSLAGDWENHQVAKKVSQMESFWVDEMVDLTAENSAF